jgi:hypothetical protein
VPSGSGETPPRLTFGQVAPVIDVIAAAPEPLILVGGQAVNFWAEFYAPRVPELRAQGPFTSGDIDVTGPSMREAAIGIARSLAGRFQEPDARERTAILAMVTYRDANGDERVVDFMRRLWRVEVSDVERTALALKPGLRVMHPVWCVESRVHNVIDLRDYQTPEGLNQARVAILIAREFLKDALDAGETEAVLKLNERIFKLARNRAAGCARFDLHPFNAVLADPRLPEAFLKERYPRMRSAVERAAGLGSAAALRGGTRIQDSGHGDHE